VATVLNNLANILRDTNRPTETESLLNRALAIDETSFGPMHPAVARDLKNLAQFFKVWDRSADAVPLIHRVIEILQDMERQSGRPVLEIGPALNFQAEIFAETDHVADAETCYRKALALDEKNYPLDSARVAKDLSGLAELLKATKRRAEAASLLHRAHGITAKVKHSKDAVASRGKQCLGLHCGIDDKEGI
jgi:tetratricopeptide (TPR) repeat protein